MLTCLDPKLSKSSEQNSGIRVIRDDSMNNLSVPAALRSLSEGEVLLYPTDGLPGLGFDPRNLEARTRLTQVKGRSDSKPVLGLVDSLEMALSHWEPLPQPWTQVLNLLWPGPLTVVWLAKQDSALPGLVSDRGRIALRWPKLLDEDRVQVIELIRRLGLPLPSTSVNQSGDPAITCWKDAQAFARRHAIHVLGNDWSDPESGRGSTVISLDRDGSFELLRQGPTSLTAISGALNQSERNP